MLRKKRIMGIFFSLIFKSHVWFVRTLKNNSQQHTIFSGVFFIITFDPMLFYSKLVACNSWVMHVVCSFHLCATIWNIFTFRRKKRSKLNSRTKKKRQQIFCCTPHSCTKNYMRSVLIHFRALFSIWSFRLFFSIRLDGILVACCLLNKSHAFIKRQATNNRHKERKKNTVNFIEDFIWTVSNELK